MSHICRSTVCHQPARHWSGCVVYGLLALSLAACGGGAQLDKQIKALEKSGAVPALDRTSSIAGPDLNKNGVRDDIEAYITHLPLAPVQQRAALQKARAIQLTLTVDLTDKVALQKVGDALMASSNCLHDKYAEGASELSHRIEAMTANTRERAKHYMEYNAARSGSFTILPNGDTCE